MPGTVDSPLHIGFLTSDLSHTSGWAHYSLSLIQALRRASVRVTVITAHNSPAIEGLPIARLLPNVSPPERFSLPRMIAALPSVRALLKDCTLIHATAEPYAFLAGWVAGKRPLIVTGHGSYVHLPELRHFPINWLYRQAFLRARLVCVSRYTARIAQQVTPGVHTIVVNNGVDVERFANISPLLHRMERGSGGEVILTAGGVKARKGTLELVKAVASVRQRLPDVQCVILGSTSAEPAYTARVRATITELGLDDCVTLLGFVPGDVLLNWYANADVFVLPSINVGWKFEGYGLVHMEASAAGLPVIGTTDCGAEDAIDDGITGMLVPQAQVEQKLPQAILDVLSDKTRAARMGTAGREKAHHQTWDHVAQQMIAVYAQV